MLDYYTAPPRKSRNGRLNGPQALPIAPRFWSKINKDGPIPAHCPQLGPCWLWTGGTRQRGYGSLSGLRAHRISWGIHFGPIPPALLVCHHCDNRLCVRPDHLFLGTHSDNSRDMVSKRRHRAATHPMPRGSASNNSKLKEDQVVVILRRYTEGALQADLARQFGVGQTTISAIVRRLTWRHLPIET